MAFPVVETTNESATPTASTSHIVNLPGSLVSGNLILILCDKGTPASTATFNALAGWTELLDENVASGIAMWYRVSDGTEGATVTFTSTVAIRDACTAYQISGAADPATQAPQLSTLATGTSANPNATTCTPTGGAKDYLWITMFGQAGEHLDDDSLTTVTPTGYSNPLEKTCGTAGTNLGGMIASAQQQLNAASQDASAWTSSDATAWRAYTIAVHPSTNVTGTVAVTQADQTSAASGEVVNPGFNVFTRTGSNGTAGTSHTVTLVNGSNVSGREAIVIFSCDSGTVSWPADWSELFDTGTSGVTMAAAYRILDGTEGFDGTDDTITVTSSASTMANWHAYLISAGHHASQAPEAASTAPGTPDPPNLDPAGWATEEALWIAASASRFSGTYTAAPTNYTDLVFVTVGSDIAPLGSARRVLSASAENPGVFTEGGGNTTFVTATIAVRPAATGDITGTVAETQDNQTSTASGVLGYTGTLAETQDAQTAAASGVLGYSGTVARTQADQTSTAAGQLGYTGTLAETQDPQTSTASGTVGGAGAITGTLAETQDAQTSTATGQLGYSGLVAASQGNQTATAAGWITITGTLAETQANQTATAVGQLGATGSLARTQANQVSTAVGWITITGLVARTQADQTCTAAGFTGELPIPSGHPVYVSAGSHAVAAGRSDHAVTVPAGMHVVEVE